LPHQSGIDHTARLLLRSVAHGSDAWFRCESQARRIELAEIEVLDTLAIDQRRKSLFCRNIVAALKCCPQVFRRMNIFTAYAEILCHLIVAYIFLIEI